ncbi:hypothetical protein EFO90_09080 [Lactiplantibacillus plantarum]|nr:hypothetical protein [Lactiplantibacillus plantarum]MCT3272097.1 hypothetical protein [Lactiplantibacillus plantarum]
MVVFIVLFSKNKVIRTLEFEVLVLVLIILMVVLMIVFKNKDDLFNNWLEKDNVDESKAKDNKKEDR